MTMEPLKWHGDPPQVFGWGSRCCQHRTSGGGSPGASIHLGNHKKSIDFWKYDCHVWFPVHRCFFHLNWPSSGSSHGLSEAVNVCDCLRCSVLRHCDCKCRCVILCDFVCRWSAQMRTPQQKCIWWFIIWNFMKFPYYIKCHKIRGLYGYPPCSAHWFVISELRGSHCSKFTLATPLVTSPRIRNLYKFVVNPKI